MSLLHPLHWSQPPTYTHHAKLAALARTKGNIHLLQGFDYMAGLGEGQSGWSEDSPSELAKEAAGSWLSPAVCEGLTWCIYIWCRHRFLGEAHQLHYPEGPKVRENRTVALEDAFIHSPPELLLCAERLVREKGG